MQLWKKHFTIAELNQMLANSASDFLGIKITEQKENALIATMPLTPKTTQPFGALHGGISAALAETLGSLAGYLAVEDGKAVVGIEINASHLRAVLAKQYDYVQATASPLRIGNRLQVWQIDICDPAGKLCCSSRLTLSSITI